MIILGYPGIGKSTLTKSDTLREMLKIIDLESSMFKFDDGKRPKHWEEQWCKVAIDLCEQGYNVLGPTHAEIRQYLNEHYDTDKFVAICPALIAEEAWESKLWDRWVATKAPKDYNAWATCKISYKENISSIRSSVNSYTIFDVENYDLARIIVEILTDYNND